MNLTHDALSNHIYIQQVTYFLSLAMAMMMEVEDDVFFADLNREISILITDDNEDGDEVYYSHPSSSYPTLNSIQGISRTSMFQATQAQYHIDHFDQMNYKTSTTPTIDHSKGTGVFIPKSSSQWNKSRRSKSTRTTTNYNNNHYNSYNNFRHHQQQSSQTMFSQVTINGSKKY